MIRYYKGTVFNSGCEWLVNTVNCEGVMGAGIALEFRLRYPEMFEDYKSACKRKEIKTGTMHYYEDSKILNFPTKESFSLPSFIGWIEDGLKNFVKTYKEYGIKSIAFSKLGCGKGGLNWNAVKALMEKYLEPLSDIDIVICLDENDYAEGKELEMVTLFNNTDLALLKSNGLKLNKKQIDSLQNIKPLDRFYKLFGKGLLGITNYEKLFRLIYTGKFKVVKPKVEESSTQIEMF